MRSRLYRRPQRQLAEREAQGAVAQHAKQLRESGFWFLAGAIDRCWARDESPGTNLAHEAGDGEQAARAHRSSSRLGDGAELPEWRKSRTLAWASRQAAAGAQQGP